MDQGDREKIRVNEEFLTSHINFDVVKPHLVPFKIFTEEMVRDLSALTGENRIGQLIKDLPTRGPNAFKSFVNILKETKQLEASQVLDNNVNNNLPFQPPLPVILHDRVRTDSMSEGVSGGSFIFPTVQVFEGDTIYKMSSCPRGYCLLINNMDFKKSLHSYDYRFGSEVDEKRLNGIFKDLGFLMELHRDLTAEGMREAIKKFSLRSEHENMDAAVIIILSHGEKDTIVGVDGNKIIFNDILKMFSNYSCPFLQKKPKLFFTQACRGDFEDFGTPSRLTTDSRRYTESKVELENSLEEDCIRIPTLGDMLVSFSSIDDFKSYRDRVSGGWYVTSLAAALQDHAHEWDLVEILLEMERKMETLVGQRGERTATEIKFLGFKKKLYFNPKHYS